MMSNSIEKFVLAVVGTVIAFTLTQAYRSTVKLKEMIHQFALLETLRHCPSVPELPLIRPIKWIKQRNAGRNPCKRPYPDIKIQNLLDVCELSSNRKGIW